METNLVNVAFTSLVTVVVVSWLGEGTGVIVATAVGTLALLLLGEVIPKTMAVRNSERVAFIYATPLTWIEYLLLPFVEVLHRLTEAINSITGGQGARGGYLITEAEVRTLIDIGEEQGALEPEEAELLEKVFHFGGPTSAGHHDSPPGDSLGRSGRDFAGFPEDLFGTNSHQVSGIPRQFREHRGHRLGEGTC